MKKNKLKKGLRQAQLDQLYGPYETLEELHRANRSRYTIFDWASIYWHRYFWNYVSSIPLNIKSFIQRGLRGYADSDVWDFDRYLTDVIEGGITQLKKQNTRADVAYAEDMKIIIKTMQLSRSINDSSVWYASKEEWTKAQKCFKDGMKVLAKRWFQLWD